MIKAIIIRQRNRLLTLLGAVGCGLTLLSSCANYDNLDFVSVTGEVKHTQLALSASGSNATTRASSAITQADERSDGSHFRGISDLYLLPFQITKTDREYIGSNDTPSGSQVVAGSNTVDRDAILDDGGANSKYYMDVVIPVGTNAFLVYGRATGNNSTLAERQTNGILEAAGLTSTVGTTPGGISFAPVQMVSSITTGNAAGSTGDAIIAYLNSIFAKQDGETMSKWADATNYPVLNNLYDMVKAMQAGSSASVIAFVQEIYDAIKNSTATGISDVLAAITSSTYVDVSDDGKLSFKEAYQGYPTTDLGLPEGAAVVSWNESTYAFEAVTTKNNFNGLNTDVTNFVFPAELYYRANSRIHTSEVELTDAETQAETIFNRTKWDVDNGSVLEQPITNGSSEKLFTPNGMVYNTTTVVAITDPLQYAVSRLDMKLTASGETLQDNAEGTPNEIPVSGLKITGVLVGQQSPVDYLFHSKWTKDGDPLYTIYDSQIDVDASTFGASKFTHTLVMETLKDQTVNIAVELQNNSNIDIVTGADKHIVPPGCKFYLVGQLVIKTEGTNEGDPATYITGYDANDPAKNRVFYQDHVTEVTFTVANLKNGYYVIPPLSSMDLEFSLSVLDWKLSTPTSTILK